MMGSICGDGRWGKKGRGKGEMDCKWVMFNGNGLQQLLIGVVLGGRVKWREKGWEGVGKRVVETVI